MRTIIFSDTHLSNKFDQQKFKYLKKIVSGADKVIINGDFWDGYLCGFTDFINSPWRKLFPLLKAKTIYLFGNHDKKEYADKRVNLFSYEQKNNYKLKAGKLILHIEHGDRIAPAEDVNTLSFFKQKLIVSPYVFIREFLPFKILGKKSLSQYKKQNSRMKNWLNDNLSKDKILVCGHSHLEEFDLKQRFINTGMIRHGIGQYLRIINDNIEPVDEEY